MIVSASRRTDLPAFYSEWLFNRLKLGCVLIPNPRFPKKLSRVALSPDVVDCIVFWSKNPEKMLSRLSELDEMGYNYYFEFTLTPYGCDLERNLPDKSEIISTFKKLSNKIGSLKIDWRYDPIIVNDTFTLDYHRKKFESLCSNLSGYTDRCIISFIDPYRHIADRFFAMTEYEILSVSESISKTAGKYGIELFTCSEEIDLSSFGILHSSCVDRAKIEKVIGCKIKAKKDPSQRRNCGCIESVDIGTYDTCMHGCEYCYAVASTRTAKKRYEAHLSDSPMLTGSLCGNETIFCRETKSLKLPQSEYETLAE